MPAAVTAWEDTPVAAWVDTPVKAIPVIIRNGCLLCIPGTKKKTRSISSGSIFIVNLQENREFLFL